MRVHSERAAVASLALYPVDDPTSYGLVRKDPQTGAVTEFLEKPDPAVIDTDEVNAGAYVLERSVADLIPAGRPVSIEREIFPRLVGQGLFGLRLEGYWMDIGTPERYLQASWDILTGRVETEVGARVSAGIGIDEHADVDGSAHVEGPVLVDSGANVAGGAHLGPRAIVGRDCQVGEGAVVVGSVLHADCTVAAGARVEGAILGTGVKVGANALVEDGAIVGEGARIEPGVRLEHDARVEPGMVAA
jgi:mannose-1-phosphate guanylyltransferase